MKQIKIRKKSRPTVGLLIDWTTGQYHLTLLNGIADLAEERDVNLLCFEGGSIWSPREFEAQRNVVYNLVCRDNLDGVIVLATLGHYGGSRALQELCRQYRPLPIVSIGVELEDIPSIMVDNESGMRDLVSHLIEVHDYKK